MNVIVLCHLEMLCIMIKDVAVDELISMEHACPTKRRHKGFRFKMPNWLASTLNKHVGNFKMDLTKNCRLMRNYDSENTSRTQDMGEGKISKFTSVLAHCLEKDDLKKCS